MRIMVVDDDFIVRAKLVELFGRYGECTSVSGGRIAIRKFEQALRMGKPYDLISLDLDMPDLLGEETLRMIREWEKTNFCEEEYEPIKFLVVTGAKDSKSAVSVFSLGAQGYITKPVSFGKVQAAMEELFGLTAS